jgi:hypothetical protein
MAQENKQGQQPTCPGDCLKCFPAQRQYCASQHAYSNMKVLDRVMETLARMQEQMDALQACTTQLAEKLEAGEASVFAAQDVSDPGLFPRMYGNEPEPKEE